MERRSLTKYSVTRVNRCKYRDGSNSLRDDIASYRAARPTCRGTGSCEAGLTPATLPAEPSRSPTTGMPCVKMPPCLCAQIVCAPPCVVRRARVCVRDVGCVKRASALGLTRFFPPSRSLFFFLSLRVCLGPSITCLSSPISPRVPSSPLVSPPYPPGPLGLLSLSSPLRVFHSRLLSSVPRQHEKKKKVRKYILVRHTDLLED